MQVTRAIAPGSPPLPTTAGQEALTAFGDDLARLGAVATHTSGDTLVARFATSDAAAFARGLVRERVTLPPGAAHPSATLQIEPGVGQGAVDAHAAAAAIRTLDGVVSADAFRALEILHVSTVNTETASRLHELLRETIGGLSVLVVPEGPTTGPIGWGSGIG